MKKMFLLVLGFLICCTKGYTFEIVYPKTNPVKISASSTFFIGFAKPCESLKINDIVVKVLPNGAFAQVVPLNAGINNFVITSGADTVNFVINSVQPKAALPALPEIIEYPSICGFYVKNDNVPLRMTPIDGGINRMSHLPKGTRVFINGEQGNFYRVYLNSKLSGWIAKSDVERSEKYPKTAEIKKFEIKKNMDFCFYELELTGKVPFVLKEDNGLTLQLFNVKHQIDDTYTLNIPIKKLMGYEGYYKKDKLILKIRKFPQIDPEKPLKNIKIAIDAGHGGKEFGAIGCCGDKEKDINLAIAKGLKSELGNRGAKIIMTRDDDIDLSLADRVKIAKEKNAALLLSIHANALPDGEDPNKNRGTSIYYYYKQAKPLANCILNSMTTQLCTQNDKVRQGSLALVRPTLSVSVLIEVAYIINPDDCALLLDKIFQINCAKAIADGIERYLLN